MKPEVTFQQGGGKKKGGVPGKVNNKMRIRSASEKKERQWGKTPQKPYISSSVSHASVVVGRRVLVNSKF